MIPNVAPKFQTRELTEETRQKIISSFEECTSLPERKLICPYCDHFIQSVFSDTVGHVRVKCNKCKAEMILNVAYFFRKYRTKSRYKYDESFYSRKIIKN